MGWVVVVVAVRALPLLSLEMGASVRGPEAQCTEPWPLQSHKLITE